MKCQNVRCEIDAVDWLIRAQAEAGISLIRHPRFGDHTSVDINPECLQASPTKSNDYTVLPSERLSIQWPQLRMPVMYPPIPKDRATIGAEKFLPDI
jgi:hypothetical protein